MGTEEPHANGHSRDESLLVRVRPPQLGDGGAIWELVRGAELLSSGGQHVAPVLAGHFADTSLVAEAEGRVVGFVGGYRPPTNRPSLFVWQIDVAPAFRGKGLGSALLHALVRCPGCEGIEYIEATVSSSNRACRQLFEGFARDVGTACEVTAEYASGLTASTSNEREDLFVIGPIRIEDVMKLETPHDSL